MRIMLLAAAKKQGVSLKPFKTVTKFADMDMGLNGSVVWVNGGLLRILSGQRDTNLSDSNLRNYYLTGEFVNKVPMPAPRYATDIALVNGGDRGYMWGGRYNGSWGQAGNDLTNLNTQTRTALTWGPSSTAYSNRAISDGGNYIYVIISGTCELHRFRIDTGARVQLATMPVTGMLGGAVFMHEGDLYHFGGWSGSSLLPNVYKYSVATNQWSLYDTIPDGMGSTHQGQGGYADGVFNYMSWKDTVYRAVRYDVKNKKFVALDTALGYRNMAGSTFHDGSLYVVGGSTVPLGSGGFGAAATNLKSIYKISL